MKSRHSYEVQRLSLDELKITRANPRVPQQRLSHPLFLTFPIPSLKKQAAGVFEVSSIVL